MNARILLFPLILVLATVYPSAQPAPPQTGLVIRPAGEALFPLTTYDDLVTGTSKPLYSGVGWGGGAALEYAVTPWFVPFARGMYSFVPFAGGSVLKLAEAGAGFGLVWAPDDRFSLRGDVQGGWAEVFLPTLTGTSLTARSQVGLKYRLAPSLSLSAFGGYSSVFGSQKPILSAFTAGLSFEYDLSALAGTKPKVTVTKPQLDSVFPSLYAYYDDNPFGTVTLKNLEDASIRDVKVSFSAGHYMDNAKVCAQYEVLASQASVEVPITALFTDAVLSITQGTEAKGEILVQYTYLGSPREVREPIDFRMHHRNAITWSDDRRAAAFVSPTNPASQWFAKFASGIVRDRMRGGVNKPLQTAMGIFEAEKLYGLNYVVVPTNDYSVKHGIKDFVDTVQFPHQTLVNRGGDCSDLAVLFSSLMQSVGVQTAFITIPGHIFSAFDTGLDEATARAEFYDPSLLIFIKNRAWVPVEITMVRDGFIKAWRVAAKEWVDNVKLGSAAFYTLEDCWTTFPPAAVPDVNPRFVLPNEQETAVAFDSAVDRYVVREISPQIASLENELKTAAPGYRANEIGALYARYGMLKEAWKFFTEGTQKGSKESWTNLGNVAFLRQDYKLALKYFNYALVSNPKDDLALLGATRCQYELEDFGASDQGYVNLRTRNPALAGQFGYLASIYGGEGRAWSLADRFATTNWAREKIVVAEAAPLPALVARPLPAVASDVVEPAPAPPAWKPADTQTFQVAKPVPAPAPAPASTPAVSPQPAPAPVLAAVPELPPEPVSAPAPAPTPAAVPEPAPAPVPEPALPPPAIAELPPEPAPATTPEQTLAAAPEPAPEPVPEPLPPPPAIAELPPEPAPATTPAPIPIAAPEPAPEPVPEPLPPPPAIAELPPEPAPAPTPEPTPAAAPVPAPELVPEPLPPPPAIAELPPEPAPAPAPVPTPAAVPEPAPELVPEPLPPPPAIAELPPEPAPAPTPAPTTSAAPEPALEPVPEPLPPPPAIAELPPEPAPAPTPEPTPAAAPVPAPELVPEPLPPPPAIAELPPEPAPAPTPAPTTSAAPEPAPEPVPEPLPPPPAIAELPPEPAPAPTPAPTPAAPEPAPEPVPEPLPPPAIAELPPEPAPAPEPDVLAPLEASEVRIASLLPREEAPLRAEPQTVWSGFSGAVSGAGTWVLGDIARQTDPKQFYAKLVAGIPQTGRPLSYSFDARTLGQGWTGLGLHVLVSGSKSFTGYGAGQSLLVWLTRDPVHYPADPVRLQIYRSRSDTEMTLMAEVPVKTALKDWNQFRIQVLPAQKTLEVVLNGGSPLTVTLPAESFQGSQIAFRSLDQAEFRNFEIREETP